MYARAPRAALGDDGVAPRLVYANSLTGAVPPELGKLTDLEDLCAAPRRLRIGDGRTRRARSVCGWLRSSLSSNRFSGTLGSWVGSLAKLSGLYAPRARTVRACVCECRAMRLCVCVCVCVCLCVCLCACE